MARPASALVAPLLAFASRLRFPVLFGLTAALFALDLLVPDAVPFADEILLGLATALLASWKRQRTELRGASEVGPRAPPDRRDVR